MPKTELKAEAHRTLTVAVHVDDVEAANWIWEANEARILNIDGQVRHGVRVLDVDEYNLIPKYYEALREIQNLQNEVVVLDAQNTKLSKALADKLSDDFEGQ